MDNINQLTKDYYTIKRAKELGNEINPSKFDSKLEIEMMRQSVGEIIDELDCIAETELLNCITTNQREATKLSLELKKTADILDKKIANFIPLDETKLTKEIALKIISEIEDSTSDEDQHCEQDKLYLWFIISLSKLMI